MPQKSSSTAKNKQLEISNFTTATTSTRDGQRSSHEASTSTCTSSQRNTRSTTASGSLTSTTANAPSTHSDDFESFVRETLGTVQAGLSSVLDGQRELGQRVSALEKEISSALDFQSSRIDEVSSKVEELGSQLAEVEVEAKKINEFDARLDRMERHSRRNNLRLVGFPYGTRSKDHHEDCIRIVQQVLHDFKNTEDVRIERAHRDGLKRDGRIQHILIKFLSYQDKINIIKQSRTVLQGKSFFVDDLIKNDYMEKQKWSKQVKEAYERGVRYHFAAGRWRNTQGNQVTFT